MDRVWQRLWDRFGSHYSWVFCAVVSIEVLFIEGVTAAVMLGYVDSDRYLGGAVVAVASALLWALVSVRPGRRWWYPVERWATGGDVDVASALRWTYDWARAALVRSFAASLVCGGMLGVGLGVLTEAGAAMTLEFAAMAASANAAAMAIAVHSFLEGAFRPPRLALIGDTDLGDLLPRSRPTFATWTNIAIVASAVGFTLIGSGVAATVDEVQDHPALGLVTAVVACAVFAIPMTVATAVAPSLRPLRDLAEGTERVVAGNYTQRLPVVQDDDLGALAASFNRMQAGLAERERLQAAFGTYVDPALASRLLEQGDDVFTGERRGVTVMFVDIRDFTPFAEANSAEDTVAQLNALFEIVVPAVIDAGGHVNKFLGDGAMAVFGAPNELPAHADAAVATARSIQRLVAERFGDTLRIGIGINTGVVIAGTIGGGGKLEFTLIGDTVNVAARVEQLTKATGDAVLLTQSTLDALGDRPSGLVARGSHELKGKAAPVGVYGLSPGA